MLPIDHDKLGMCLIISRAMTEENHAKWCIQKHCKSRKMDVLKISTSTQEAKKMKWEMKGENK